MDTIDATEELVQGLNAHTARLSLAKQGLNAPMLTDQQLSEFLNIEVQCVQKLTPQQRLAYECLYQLEQDLMLYSSGKGPKPKYAIVCEGHAHD